MVKEGKDGEWEKVIAIGVKTQGQQIMKAYFCDNKGFLKTSEL